MADIRKEQERDELHRATEWGVSHFEREEELLKELSYEPEYKQFF